VIPVENDFHSNVSIVKFDFLFEFSSSLLLEYDRLTMEGLVANMVSDVIEFSANQKSEVS